MFKNGVQLYLPLFALVQFATKRKLDLHAVKQLLSNVARSSLFLVLNGPGTMVAVCSASKVFGVHHPMALGPLATVVAYTAINVEKKARRRELALYMVNLVIEALFRMGVNRGYWRPVKHGLPVLFALASAGLLGFYNSERQSLGNVKHVLDVFVGEKELPDFADRFLARNVLPSSFSPFLKWVISGFIKMTTLGFGLRFITSLISSIFARTWPRRIKALIRGTKRGAKFGIFLGLFSTLSRLMPTAIAKVIGHPKTASALAGFLAGCAAFIYPSAELSMYLLVKLIDALFNAGVSRKIITPVAGGDAVVFSTMTGFLFYVGVFEHFCLRRSYWHFLLRMSGYRLKTVPQFAPRLGAEYAIPQGRLH